MLTCPPVLCNGLIRRLLWRVRSSPLKAGREFHKIVTLFYKGIRMNQNSYVDYYEDLQVSPDADLETIERVYRLLAKRYHPDNSLTGNNEKFSIFTTAYKILSDAEKRAAFDAKYEGAQNHKIKVLSNVALSEGFEYDQQIRHAILSILYVDRKQNPSDSGVGSWRLEKLLE